MATQGPGTKANAHNQVIRPDAVPIDLLTNLGNPRALGECLRVHPIIGVAESRKQITTSCDTLIQHETILVLVRVLIHPLRTVVMHEDVAGPNNDVFVRGGLVVVNESSDANHSGAEQIRLNRTISEPSQVPVVHCVEAHCRETNLIVIRDDCPTHVPRVVEVFLPFKGVLKIEIMPG